MVRRVPVRAIRRYLFSDAETNVYAVLDAANAPDLLDKLYELRPPFACLYNGELEADMAEVAPYLVQLDADGPFTRWLLEQGWGRNWGIFLTSPGDLRAVRRHLRTFLMVYDPDGQPLYFRYYDPRVLRTYLPTCNAEETQFVFGPVERYLLEDQDTAILLRFRPAGALPVQESLILVGGADEGA